MRSPTNPFGTVRCAGFTLLEVVLFVLIMMIMMGFLIPAFSGSGSGEELRRTSVDLEKLVRTLRREAVATGTSHRVLITPSGIAEEAALRDGDAEEPVETITLSWPAGSKVRIRSWPSEEWFEPEEWSWVFQPSGLVLPIEFRLDSGEAWIEVAFSPVTGEIVDEKFYLP